MSMLQYDGLCGGEVEDGLGWVERNLAEPRQ